MQGHTDGENESLVKEEDRKTETLQRSPLGQQMLAVCDENDF